MSPNPNDGSLECCCGVESSNPHFCLNSSLENYRLVGSQRLVLALRRYLPMLVLFGSLETQILSGGCRRGHPSLR